MAPSKKTPPPRLHADCVSDPAWTHSTLLKGVAFDDAGHLLCTDANGAWSAWRLHDGARVHHRPCEAPNLVKPGPLRPLRAHTWLGWNGLDDRLSALDAATGTPSPLDLPPTTWRVGAQLVTLLPTGVTLRDPDTLALRATHPLDHTHAHLVAAAGDFLVYATPSEYWAMRLSTGETHRLSLPGGAQVLAVRGRDGLVLARDTASTTLFSVDPADPTMRPVASLPTQAHVAVFGVADDTLVCCGDNEGVVRCLQLADAHTRWTAPLEASVAALALSPDGQTLAVAVGQRACLLDAQTGQRRDRPGPVWPPTALSLGESPLTLCASPSRRQQLPGKVVYLLTPGDGRGWRPVAGALGHAAGAHLVTLDEDAQVGRWPLTEAPDATGLPKGLGLGTGALAVGDAGEVVRGRYDARRSTRVLEVVRWDAAGAQQVTALCEDKKKHPALCAHSAAGLVAVGAEDKQVVVYALATGARVCSLTGLKQPADRVVLSGDGRFVAAIALKQVMCWSLDAGTGWTQKLDEAAGSVCFADGGRLVLVGTTEQLSTRPARLHAWQSADGAARGVATAPWSTSTPALAVGADGAVYAAAGDLNVYRVTLPDAW